MSYSTIQAIWPGEKHENLMEYQNSYGTAPIVWNYFCEKHLRLDKYWWLSNATKTPNLLWNAWKRADIPESHRAVLLFTCDNIYVKKQHYRRFAKDLRQFLEAVMISANTVNHWPRIAQQFEMEPEYPALALWCTSVTADRFDGPYNEETNDYEPFDWDKSWSLYDELDDLEK